jgi:VanZ family protein
VGTARRHGILVGVTVAYVLALTAASLLPSGDSAGPLEGWDKDIRPGVQNLLHVPAYAVLVWFVAEAAGLRRLPCLATAAVVCAAFGGLLEWAQAAIPGRMGSVEDMLLNALGALAGLAVVVMLRKRTGREKREPHTKGAAGEGVSGSSL